MVGVQVGACYNRRICAGCLINGLAMDADELKEEILHQRELQKEYRKRLRALGTQQAKLGIRADPSVETEIEDMRNQVLACEQRISVLSQLLTCERIFHGNLKLASKLSTVIIRSLKSDEYSRETTEKIIETAETIRTKLNDLAKITAKMDGLHKQYRKLQ
jgi:hypothetical protein